MGQISYPNKWGCQAIHKAAGKTFRRYFSYRKYGSCQRAEEVANRWLDWCDQIYKGRRGQRSDRQISEPINFPVGITYSKGYRRFVVQYRTGGKQRAKSFSTGASKTRTEIESYEHALKAAKAFRRDFEQCRDEGKEFDPSAWKHWRKMDTEDI